LALGETQIIHRRMPMKKIALIFSCVLLSGCVSWGNLKRLNSIIPTVEALVLLKDRVDNGMDVGKVGTDEVSDIPEKDVDLILAIGRAWGIRLYPGLPSQRQGLLRSSLATRKNS